MIGIIYGVIASVLFSILFITLKKSYETFSPEITYFFYMVFGLIVWIPFSFWYGFTLDSVGRVFPYALLSAVLSEALSFYVLSKGEISITGTILASYPIYTVLLSWIFLGESASPVVLFFVGLTILGTIIASLPVSIEKSDLKNRKYIIWAVIGALAVGISDTTSKSIINETSAAEFLFSLAIAQIPVSLLYLNVQKSRLPSLTEISAHFSKYKYLLITVVLNVFAIVCMWLAFENTLAIIASPISASFPGLMVILALIFLKEKPRLFDIVGLFLIIIGVLGVSFYAA